MEKILDQKKSNLVTLVCFVLFFAPSLCLSYVLTVKDIGEYNMPFGQYLFFFATVMGSSYLLLRFKVPNFLSLFYSKLFLFFVILYLVGVFSSQLSWVNLRLFQIISFISFSMVLLAFYLERFKILKDETAVVLILFPFLFPVVSAFLLEYFGPLNVGIEVDNVKHLTYRPKRWHFLYQSANGFGLSAALVFFGCYAGIFSFPKLRIKALLVILGLISGISLYYSGTRAAFLFAIFSISIFHFFFHGKRFTAILMGVVALLMLLYFLFGDLDYIKNLVRIKEDINSTTSTRFQGIIGLWKLFELSPFYGRGFGAADLGLPVNPTNILYAALPVEIGLFGFVGAVGILFFPLLLSVPIIASKKELPLLKRMNFLFTFSFCTLIAFVPYCAVEFKILRVSPVNQLFFFCWGYVYFSLSHQKNSVK